MNLVQQRHLNETIREVRIETSVRRASSSESPETRRCFINVGSELRLNKLNYEGPIQLEGTGTRQLLSGANEINFPDENDKYHKENRKISEENTEVRCVYPHLVARLQHLTIITFNDAIK